MDADAGGVFGGSDKLYASGFHCRYKFTKIAATRGGHPGSIFIANNCSDRDA